MKGLFKLFRKGRTSEQDQRDHLAKHDRGPDRRAENDAYDEQTVRTLDILIKSGPVYL